MVALGSVLGTIKDTIDELRDGGMKIGALGITSFRPFPLEAVRAALSGCQRVVVLEKALAVGIGGIVSANVRMALSGIALHGYTVIAGLGGRAITKASLRELFLTADRDALEPLTFLDLDTDLVEPELARVAASRQSGPGGREHAARPRRRRLADRLRRNDHGSPADQVLPDGQLRGREPPARSGPALGAVRRRPGELPQLRAPCLSGLR